MEHIQMVSLRIVREGTVPYSGQRLDSALVCYNLFRELVADQDREVGWIACLDVRNQVTCLSQISVGSLTAAVLHPRETFKIALLSNANSVILMHNHPSGDPSPSRDDIAITKRLREAADTLGIKFLDHIIIGNGKFYSFAEEGGLL